MNVYLVSNSPGEVSTFVRPVLAALKEKHPDWTVRVCLVPCPYATGAETKVIEAWPEKPQVWGPWQTTMAWLKANHTGPGLVVFLGGDPWHALLLKSRFKIPAVAYFPEPSSWENTSFRGGFDKVLLGYQSATLGESSEKRMAVGDLRVDAVRARLRPSPKEASPRLAVFPGSRWMHLKAVLGPFLKAVEMVAEDVPKLQVQLAASPFVSPEKLQNAASEPWKLGLDYTTAELEDENTLVTRTGLRVEVVWGKPYEVISNCNLALSLPGTNTAELAIAGKPAVVPLSTRVPVGGGGILGILDRLPGFGKLKKKLRMRKKNKLSLIALPNQLAGRVVTPEFIVDDDMINLAEILTELLTNPEKRAKMGQELQDVMGAAGAAVRVVHELAQLEAR